MVVEHNKYVKISYSFSPEGDCLVEASERQGSVVFRSGVGEILPAIDQKLQGCAVGEDQSFMLLPQEAYGERDENLVFQVAAQDLQPNITPYIGCFVKIKIGEQQKMAFISHIEGERIKLDANHPLAGLPIHFRCHILAINDDPLDGYCSSEGCDCNNGCSSERCDCKDGCSSEGCDCKDGCSSEGCDCNNGCSSEGCDCNNGCSSEGCDCKDGCSSERCDCKDGCSSEGCDCKDGCSSEGCDCKDGCSSEGCDCKDGCSSERCCCG